MRIYVIIIIYNGLPWIDRCMNSLRKSAHKLNVIIIDNGSTDGSQNKIMTHYPEFDFYQSEENLGFSRANNIGISRALDGGADHVFLLNQDAWLEIDTITKLLAIAGRFPEFGILSPMHLNGNSDELDFNFSRYVDPDHCPGLYSDIFLRRLKDVYEAEFINAAAWLVSANCVRAVGLFEPLFFFYGEDGNYIQRARYHGYKVGVAPSCTICHDRGHRKGKLTETASKIKERTHSLMGLLNITNRYMKAILMEIKFRFVSIMKKIYHADLGGIKFDALELIYIIFNIHRLNLIRKAYRQKGYLIEGLNEN